MEQLEDWGLFMEIKTQTHGIFPFSIPDRKDAQKFLSKLKVHKRRYETHAGRLANITRMISPLSRVTPEMILHSADYDYADICTKIMILETAIIKSDQQRQMNENSINSVTNVFNKTENHMAQVQNSEKVIYDQSQAITANIVNQLTGFMSAQITTPHLSDIMDGTSGSSTGAKRPAPESYSGLDGAPENGLDTEIDQNNAIVLRNSLPGGEKPLKNPGAIPKEPVFIDAVADGFNTDGKATTRIREGHEMYPNEPEYMTRMGYSVPKKPGKRKRVEGDIRPTAKVSKVTTQLFDKAKRGDGNVNALSNQKQLVVSNLFNSTGREQEMIRENTDVGATYLQRVRETGARFQILAKRKNTPEAAIGLAYHDLKETAPQGGQQGELGNPITMTDGSLQVGRITVPFEKWIDMYENPQKFQSRIEDRAAISSAGYQAYKAAMDKAKRKMLRSYQDIYSREVYEAMETR